MDFKVVKGKQASPEFIFLYGKPGIGKSSFAADAPNTLFIDADKRTGHLNVNRLTPTNWKEVFEILTWFKTQKYESLALDTADALEKLAKEKISEDYKKEKFDDIGDHGKNWNLLAYEFQKLVEELSAIRGLGKNIIVLAHCEVKTINDPVVGAFDRWQPSLYAKVSSAFVDKVDSMFFASNEILVKKGEKKPLSDNVRYLFTEFNPSYNAKNSFGLPAKFELKENSPFKYYLELKGDSKQNPETLKRQIESMLSKFTEEDQAKVKKNMEGADEAKLLSIKNKMEVAIHE